MIVGHLLERPEVPANPGFENPDLHAISGYRRELELRRCAEIGLRKALAESDALLARQDKLIQQRDVLSRESDHRLLNGVQMIVSLLSLQSRASANAEAASQLAVAANRVAMIVRVHRRLHSFDGLQTVAFKPYLENLCSDFSTMLSSEHCVGKSIAVEGAELDLPTATGIPLGFIVSELITNAVKSGEGQISVRLESGPETGHMLSVSTAGRGLPEGFDPAVGKGLGMKIIRSLITKIGGELRFGRGERNEGTRFTVLFS